MNQQNFVELAGNRLANLKKLVESELLDQYAWKIEQPYKHWPWLQQDQIIWEKQAISTLELFYMACKYIS
jgi:hypothetical protein